jgi:hypothetical protein
MVEYTFASVFGAFKDEMAKRVSTEQKAKVAAAIDHLLNTTDARVTRGGDFGHNSGE